MTSPTERPPEIQTEKNGAQEQNLSSGKASDELIDFGQNEEPVNQAQSNDNTQNDFGKSNEAVPPVQMLSSQQNDDLLGGDFDHQMSGFNNGTSGLQSTLEPTIQSQPQPQLHTDIKLSGSVRRLDSSSNAVDEFHDALG